MKPKLRIRRRHQLRFDLPQASQRGAPIDALRQRAACRELEIQLMVPALRSRQIRVEAAERRRQALLESGEALAGARLDERTEQQQIDEPSRLRRLRCTMQALRITRW